MKLKWYWWLVIPLIAVSMLQTGDAKSSSEPYGDNACFGGLRFQRVFTIRL
jgi:hypothetical protein